MKGNEQMTSHVCRVCASLVGGVVALSLTFAAHPQTPSHDATASMRGQLVRLGQPVARKELVLGMPRPVGEPFNLASRPEGRTITTEADGTFRVDGLSAGKYTLYDVAPRDGRGVLYDTLVWFNRQFKYGSLILLAAAQELDLGIMNYVPNDNSRVTPREGEQVGSTPQLVWGPYPGATGYRVLLFSEPTGLDWQYGMTAFEPNDRTVLFLPSTTDVSYQVVKPLPMNRTGPGATQSLLVYYLNGDTPIAVASLQFRVMNSVTKADVLERRSASGTDRLVAGAPTLSAPPGTEKQTEAPFTLVLQKTSTSDAASLWLEFLIPPQGKLEHSKLESYLRDGTADLTLPGGEKKSYSGVPTLPDVAFNRTPQATIWENFSAQPHGPQIRIDLTQLPDVAAKGQYELSWRSGGLRSNTIRFSWDGSHLVEIRGAIAEPKSKEDVVALERLLVDEIVQNGARNRLVVQQLKVGSSVSAGGVTFWRVPGLPWRRRP